jgi:hypothetical protein
MKQNRIMKMNKIQSLGKTMFFLILMLISNYINSQLNDSIELESKIRMFSFQKTEYAVLKINYKNLGQDTLYLWTQNWRIHYLNNSDKGIFEKCPYDINGGILNAITFFNNPNCINSKEVRMIMDSYVNDNILLNLSFVKKILPKDMFCTNIIFSDTSIISYLKANKPDKLLLHFSYTRNPQTFNGLSDRIFYNDDDIFIYYRNDPNLVDCTSYNIDSKNGIENEVDFHKIPRQNFESYSRIGIKLNW